MASNKGRGENIIATYQLSLIIYLIGLLESFLAPFRFCLTLYFSLTNF